MLSDRHIRLVAALIATAGLGACALAILSDALGVGTEGSGRGFGWKQIALLVAGGIGLTAGAVLLARPQIVSRLVNAWKQAQFEERVIRKTGLVILIAGLAACLLAILSDALGLGTGGSGRGFGSKQIALLLAALLAAAMGVTAFARPQTVSLLISRWKRRERDPMGAEFTTFCTFYMVAFLIDVTERWEAPVAALLFLIGVCAFYLRGITRWMFFTFLVASSVYILLVRFPDPANHNNLYVILNLFLIASILRAARRPKVVPSDTVLFESLKPILRVTVSLVYVLAGFHKLNTDFFDAEAGCAQQFFDQVWLLTPLPDVSFPGIAAVVIGASVIFWELGGGVMLWFRKTQPVMLAMSWLSHAVLAMVLFADFSSLAFALLLTFVPPAYFELLKRNSHVRVGRIQITRLGLYLFLNVAMAAVLGAKELEIDTSTLPLREWQGLVLNVALLIFIWPIVKRVLQRAAPAWSGVPMWRPAVGPRWAALLPAFVLFFGLNPYLGLRTAGTFTMFSNLQTESDESNHLLLGSNPLKIWEVQDDAVHVLKIDPRHAESGGHSGGTWENDLNGNTIPVIEFQQRIIDWRKQGFTDLSATFKYNGRLYDTTNLIDENPWHVDGYRLSHYLLDFRLVQGSGPIRCRW